MKIARNLAMMIVCMLLGIMLSLQYKSVNQHQSIASLENKRLEELKEEVIKLQNQKSELQERYLKLEEENQTFARVKAGDSEAVQQLKNNLLKARVFAGLETVKGAGIIVTLDDGEFSNVYDDDILDVVNELRASGAQAISVNDERIVAMTEIRGAGDYIMINGKQFKAPFIIKAIADPDNLERSLMMIDGIVEGLKEFVKVNIKKSDEIVIYKFVDDGTSIRTDYLTPVE
ncbi:MAG: DUF881 domain-containing protein [Acetivibrionales bacterium]|jgi:uncharacterized protein YlxW (UPF0749 family)|nr:DUF881 domain-containing protein [Bacillota bacterium]NLP08070.1 DUF881 domain-containing protein [Clostridiaceae bacterium]HOA55209.1 DUF881 domain-containing protein [Clostridiales bacterium]HPZ04715.1 DUF881 domain-containing protein [Clostridiales bacterium]HQD30723.1 DUF881 domain-containing protein [Clostridiales bacterium]